MYPALSRLEREGRLTTRPVPSSSGPARKYYRPTDAGHEALAEGVAQWRSLVETVTAALAHPVPGQPKEGT